MHYYTITDLIIMSLATFRLMRLFMFDAAFDGLRAPFFREDTNTITASGEIYLIPKGRIGYLLSCHWCMGFWCALIVAFIYYIDPQNLIIVTLAIAGIASIIQLVIEFAKETY